MTELAVSVIATLLIGGPVAWWQALHAPLEPQRVRRKRHQQINDLYLFTAIAAATLEVRRPITHTSNPAACLLCRPASEQPHTGVEVG